MCHSGFVSIYKTIPNLFLVLICYCFCHTICVYFPLYSYIRFKVFHRFECCCLISIYTTLDGLKVITKLFIFVYVWQKILHSLAEYCLIFTSCWVYCLVYFFESFICECLSFFSILNCYIIPKVRNLA